MVDAGRFGGKKEKPFGAYQYSAFAHNLMTLDEQPFRRGKAPRIVRHDLEGPDPWVESEHHQYAHLGVPTVRRLVALVAARSLARRQRPLFEPAAPCRHSALSPRPKSQPPACSPGGRANQWPGSGRSLLVV